jgi:hypothetical protein
MSLLYLMTTMPETCHCGNSSRWWRSRLNYLVCMRCCPTAQDALAILARRISSRVAPAQVRQWFAGFRGDSPTDQE